MYNMQSQSKACRGWVHCGCGKMLTQTDGRNDGQSLPRLFPDWLYLHPYQRFCSADRVTQTEMPALQQKLSPSRKAGQRPIHKDKTSFCRFQPKDCHRKIRHCQQAIVYISTSSCCDLSSSALFPSHSALLSVPSQYQLFCCILLTKSA